MGKHIRLLIFALTLPMLWFSNNAMPTGFGRFMISMPGTQCQSNCTSSQTPANIAPNPSDVLKNKDIEPQPDSLYYLAFMGVGWTTIVTVAATYLIKYLNWRPPDLYKLNVNYRF